jgi:hypothetical protein
MIRRHLQMAQPLALNDALCAASYRLTVQPMAADVLSVAVT